jgi:hypothetical protein
MKITIVKNLNNTFSIAYNSDYESAKKLKAGVEYQCEIKLPRNYNFHKKYFALLNLVFDNQETYINLNDLRHDLIIECGLYSEHLNMQGNNVKIANSISFASMDEAQFSELYDKSLHILSNHFNINKQDLIDNIEQYF